MQLPSGRSVPRFATATRRRTSLAGYAPRFSCIIALVASIATWTAIAAPQFVKCDAASPDVLAGGVPSPAWSHMLSGGHELHAPNLRPLTGVANDPAALNIRPLVSIGGFPRSQRLLQQVNVKFALDEVAPLDIMVVKSPEEALRRQDGTACDAHVAKLHETFKAARDAMGFPEAKGLADFLAWYQQEATQVEKDAAAPVIAAERAYDAACLTANIPAEMNPEWIRLAVGVLEFEGRAFCTALRTARDTVVTAKHCLVDPKSGKRLEATSRAARGATSIWLVYEAEPDKRYQLCGDTLPKDQAPFLSNEDYVYLKTATTHHPAPPWRWTKSPPPSGTPLYLRGYFDFAMESENTDRLRATAAGGCIAFRSKERCVFHACQAIAGMSGAPLFLRPEVGEQHDALEVVALHIGPSALAGKNSTAACKNVDGQSTSRSNFGYRPN